jgi:hypothetical protein
LGFGQQYAVRHELEPGVAPGFVVKSYLVTYILTEFAAHFIRYAAGNRYGRESARLGTAQHAAAIPGYLKGDFGQLGGFTAAGFAYYHHDLVAAQGRRYLLPAA